VDDTTIGTFIVMAADRAALSEEELLLLQEVAGNLSFALQYLQKEDAARFLSYFDPLTGLAKRSLFCDRLARSLLPPAGEELAVVVLDVEHLSSINDSFGRHFGDLLLQRIAGRLKRYFDD